MSPLYKDPNSGDFSLFTGAAEKLVNNQAEKNKEEVNKLVEQAYKAQEALKANANVSRSIYEQVIDPMGKSLEQPRVFTEQESNTAFTPVGSSSTVGAFLRQGNTVVSALQNGFDITRTNFDPNWDPVGQQIGTKYERYSKEFIYADTPEEVAAIRRRIDQYEKDQVAINQMGTLGQVVGYIGAGITDPINFTAAARVTKAISILGKVGQGAKTGAITGFTAGAASSTALTATGVNRDASNIAYETLAATVLGGFLGGLGGALSRSASKETMDYAREYVRQVLEGNEVTLTTKKTPISKAVTPEVEPYTGPLGEDLGVGAAQVSPETRVRGYEALSKEEGLARINETFAKRYSAPLNFLRSPTIEGITSSSPTLRLYTNELFQHNFLLGKTIEGGTNSQSVEVLMKLDRAHNDKVLQDVMGMFYKETGLDGKSFKEIKSLLGRHKQDMDNFTSEIAKAMRRGDTHDNPVIQSAAQKLRKEIDSAAKKLQELGYLKEDLTVNTAASYLTRKYNTKAILDDREGFERITTGWLLKQGEGLTPKQALAKSKEITDHILNLGDKSISVDNIVNNVSTKSSNFTKTRAFEIPDEAVEKYLVNDGIGLSVYYLNKASSLIRLGERLKQLGLEKPSDLLKSLEKEYEDLIALHPEQSEKLYKELDKNKAILNENIAIILDQYSSRGNYDSALKNLRKFQTLRLMGSTVLASMGDLIRLPMVAGLKDTITKGYLPMLRSFKSYKLAAEEYTDIGVGLELECDTLIKSLLDPDSLRLEGATGVDKAFNTAMGAFNKVSGMGYWNRALRRVAAHTWSAKTIRAAKKLANGEAVDTLEFRTYGLSDDDLRAISSQFDRFGEEANGSYIANWNKWDNPALREKFQAALLNEVESTILVPGKGDIPKIVQKSQVGRVLFQFRPYSSASTNKIFLSGIQHRDMRTLFGAISMLVMGTLIYTIRQTLAGREVKTDPTTLITQGMSRSGLFGLLIDTGFNLSGLTTRFTNRSILGSMLGPSASMIEDTWNIGKGAYYDATTDSEFTRSDAEKALKLLPFSNLFYITGLITAVYGPPKDTKEKNKL